MRDVACRTRRSGKGPSRGGEGTHVVFVRRGAFAAHLGSREYIADPGTALVSWEETEYRISHPGDAGDDFTSFELAPELAEELLGRLAPRDDVELRLSPRVQMAYAAFRAVARRGDGLACEEAALELLASALGTASRAGAGRARRAIALAAIELLNQDLAASCSVSAIADQ
ncbi:MAG TPA: AraC family ligand binding domain-containing protein, partial [Kofleriaceae bacterium]|nr:AraC family ligand binding domain-containing protein [Kofleriaceae bacterium]